VTTPAATWPERAVPLELGSGAAVWRRLRRSVVAVTGSAAPMMRRETPRKPFRGDMVELAFGILCAAAVPGLGLAYRRLAGSPAARPSRQIVAAFHGALGAAGLAILLAALDRARMPSTMGTAGFGAASAAILGFALVLGLAMAWRTLRGRRAAGALVGAHAGLAIAGLVVLSALVVLG